MQTIAIRSRNQVYIEAGIFRTSCELNSKYNEINKKLEIC